MDARKPLTTEALLVQLRMEITGHGSNVKALAREMGVPYDSFRDYVRGESKMPLEVLMRALDQLGLDLPEFAARARQRS